MKVKLKNSAHKSLKKLQKKDAKKILKALRMLPDIPFVGKQLEGKHKGFRSFRVWPFRIIYKIRDKTIVVISIGHRQSIYKN